MELAAKVQSSKNAKALEAEMTQALHQSAQS